MYVLDGDRIVYQNGPTVIATVVDGGREQAERLVAMANLAERDEEMLDKLGDTITRRNET